MTPLDLIWIAGLGGGIAALVRYAGWFTSAGALTGGLFGAHAVVVGGLDWVVPLSVFVASGSVMSRMKVATATIVNTDTRPRTAMQVLANGGWAWAALALMPWTGAEWMYPVYVGSLAAATADTWGTEVGTRWHTRAWSLRTGTWVPAGTSGAVSGSGTVASIAGAGIIAALGAVLGPLSWSGVAWVAFGGWIGSLVDSVLGAYGQAQYADQQDEIWHDEPTTSSEAPVYGTRYLTNSGVNAIATLVGAVWAGAWGWLM